MTTLHYKDIESDKLWAISEILRDNGSILLVKDETGNELELPKDEIIFGTGKVY